MIHGERNRDRAARLSRPPSPQFPYGWRTSSVSAQKWTFQKWNGECIAVYSLAEATALARAAADLAAAIEAEENRVAALPRLFVA